jgi:hypothetical protein
VRGSGYAGDPRDVLRSSIRRDTLGLTTDNQIGLRVVRRVQGPWRRHARPADDPRRGPAPKIGNDGGSRGAGR